MTRIGVAFEHLAEPYTSGVVRGICDRATELNASVMGFWGGWLPAITPEDVVASFVYDLISPDLVDGLIIVAGSTVTRSDELPKLAARYAPLPMVSIAVDAPGITCVLVDNEPGLRSLIEHLIQIHGRKRIAYIGRAPNHVESSIRFEVYRKVLAEHGIPYDDALVTEHPEYGMFAGEVGMREILGRGIVPEAVVAGNDVTAAGALRVLEERGLRVPEDVALVGYDDALFAMGMTPPLTTVHQPIRLLGERAVDALFDRLKGRPSSHPLTVPSYGVIRQSCGCDPTCSLPDFGPERRHGISDFPYGSSLRTNTQLQPTTGRIRELFERLVEDARSPGGARFRRAFAQILSDLIRHEGGLLSWQDGISQLRRIADAELTDRNLHQQAFAILDEARVLLTEAVQRAAVRAKTRLDVRVHDLYSTTTLLAGELDFASVASRIEEALPRILSRACHIILFDHATGAASLRFSMTDGVRADLPNSGIPFDLRTLLPKQIPLPAAPSFLIVQLLKHGTERFGLMLFEGVPEDAFAYLALANQVGSSIKRFEREQEIEHLHAAEKARAGELELSYRLLQTNQDKLVAAEKMASLGRLTAGIAHEMNTPIGAVRGALAELERLVDEYRQSIGVGEVTVDDHRAIADDMQRAIAIAKSASSRAATFVRHIRDQTRDMGTRDYRTFDAVMAVRETLLLLNHEIQATGCTVSFSPSQPTINLFGPPSRFAQVCMNLLTNAIDASKVKGGGPIVVELEAHSNGVVLTVRDRGVGIPKENETRIFDPMFTTKPFGEGTGLGLSLVQDIVKSDFAGIVEFESEPGAGTVFTVCLCHARRSNADTLQTAVGNETGE